MEGCCGIAAGQFTIARARTARSLRTSWTYTAQETDRRDRLEAELGSRYRIERELGGGGMSRVFLAQEIALERRIAIKVLPPEMAASVSVDRFNLEIRLAAKLQHPHIVPLLSAGELNGLPYFTMPYVEGESLRAQIARRGEAPAAEAVRILRDVASVLDYAHSMGIVHRDIKPDNVLLSHGSAMVTDLGVAWKWHPAGSFEEYARIQEFTPLGMTHSTFAQPLPSGWQENVASAPPKAARGIVFLPYPAASLVTTPADMGRFIAAHLSDGATAAGRLLPGKAVAEMHASHWRAQPSVPAVAYGFFEGEMNGHRTLVHTGDSGDHSVVFLLPEERVGFYFVYTGGDEQAGVREKLTRALMDRYFPKPLAVEAPRATAQSVANLVGRYRGAAYSHANYEKLKAMFYQMSVRDGGKGTLQVTPPGGGASIRLVQHAPLVFRGDSGETVTFRRDAGGAISTFVLSGSIWDPQSFDRIGVFDDGRFHAAAFVAITLAFVVRLLFTPIAVVARRVRHQPKPVYSRAERRWWRISLILSVLPFVTPVLALGVAFLSFKPGAIAVPRAALVVGMWLTIVSLAGLTLAPGAVLAWRRRFWSRAGRIIFSAVAVGFLIGGPLLAVWKVIPF